MAKGKCINIGKPCDLAISEEIQEADEANFVCKSCGKPLVAVGGSDNKGGNGDTNARNSKKGLIIGLCCVGAAALGVGGYFKFKPAETKPVAPVDPIETVTEAVNEDGEPADPVDPVDPEGAAETTAAQEPGVTPANPNYLKAYSLGWGTYEGPAVDGVPDGPGGTVTVKKAHSIDLKAGGEMLDVQPGDVIVNAKFRNGKLVQGFLKRKQGEGKNFNIGI